MKDESLGGPFYVAAKKAVKEIVKKNIHLDSPELWELIRNTLPNIPKSCLKEAVKELGEE